VHDTGSREKVQTHIYFGLMKQKQRVLLEMMVKVQTHIYFGLMMQRQRVLLEMMVKVRQCMRFGTTSAM
jgi:hypothetical protein